MESFILGRTRQNLPISAHRFGRGGCKVLILGGVHGDETEGVILSLGLMDLWMSNYNLRIQITLVPQFNLDGVLAKTRMNAAGVDLNRNLSTKDWSPEIANPRYHPGPHAGSEPENQALIQFLDVEKPRFILSLHSWKPLLNVNGDCEPEARAMAALTGYEVSPTIGYSTPGCLGTYCGLERRMPTLTYEIERGLEAQRILKEHVPAVLAGLKVTEER